MESVKLTNEELDFETFVVKVNGKYEYRFNYTYGFGKVSPTRSIIDFDVNVDSWELCGKDGQEVSAEDKEWFEKNPKKNIQEYLEEDVMNYEGCYIESKCY